MTEPGQVEPWLALACEQIAVDTFAELIDQLETSTEGGREHIRAAAHDLIEARITDLLGRRNGPEMVFQPIVMLETRQTIGVEAYSRFPTGPSTAHWFRDATDVGMSNELELSALMKAFEHIGALPGNLLCVNVSARLLDDRRLYEALNHVDANQVVVEITQPGEVADCKRLLDGLTMVRSLGLRIAFDDVGAGFLGLEHVVDIAPEIIKLSPALTTELDGDRASLDPARRLVDAARRSGTFVIAKGVESPADVDTLNQLGVEAAQGFYLGGPVPATELGR